jgi:hypothetical protein
MPNKIAIVVLLIALAWGLEQVVVSPLETGAVYPEYSTLRSDPMGAMALYESLAKVMLVDRIFKSRMQKIRGKGTAIFVLGVEPLAWSKLESDTFKEYEELTSKGARLVIAFLPLSKNWPTGEKPVEARWHIRLIGKELRPGPEWKTLDKGVLERPLGTGTVVLVSYSYPLSNEGLREDRDAGLIVKLVGSAHEVVFDENHFGVAETGSVTKLMRKYHLEGALAVLALVAALFLWRSASSFLPSRAPRSEQAVAGRDSLEGMTALLRRGIAEKDLVRICVEEWKKTPLNDHKSLITDALIDQKNVVEAYRGIAKALVEKT